VATANENALIKKVARQLLIGLLVMGLVALGLAAFMAKSAFVTPILIGVCGFIGGFIGIQRRLKSLTLGDLELLSSSWVYTILAPLVGGVLAIVLYILFLSGLLSGELFPQFAEDVGGATTIGFQKIMMQHAETYQDYGKLFFWSFVAGYSEKFVTDVVAKFEGTAVSAAAQAPLR
jgi:hypothetical protein